MEDFSKYNGEGTDLRKLQMRLLDIFIEIDRICRKHDIKYYLDWCHSAQRLYSMG